MTPPILREFPYSFHTRRLTIRGPLPGDGLAMHTAVAESREHLLPWMPWAASETSATDYEVLMRHKHLDFLARKDMQLLLFLRQSDTLIGSSGLHRPDWSVPKAEIGYWVRVGYEGQGYITEAVNAIVDFAFEKMGMARLEIRCDGRNTRSAAVARRCGFELEGTLHFDARHHQDQSRRDTLLFSRLAPHA